MKCPQCFKEDIDCECGFVLENVDCEIIEADYEIKEYLDDPPDEINIDLDLLDQEQELNFDD